MIEKSPEKLQPLKILIADDDEPTRILLHTVISEWGYEVIEAKDGEEAWEIMQQPDAPLLLVLDWLMPKLYGTELCARIREKLAIQPYIILLTPVVGTSNTIKGLEIGADEFIAKPFNVVELRTRISVGEKQIRFKKTAIDQQIASKQALSKLETQLNKVEQELKSIPEVQRTQVLNHLQSMLQLITNCKKEH